ncbi:MAG: hypothetical protein JKY71_08100 [Alphaproteobacteria bacterium]|nr:hypothetical protein [Alphaproteobacteria bacterium]
MLSQRLKSRWIDGTRRVLARENGHGNPKWSTLSADDKLAMHAPARASVSRVINQIFSGFDDYEPLEADDLNVLQDPVKSAIRERLLTMAADQRTTRTMTPIIAKGVLTTFDEGIPPEHKISMC